MLHTEYGHSVTFFIQDFNDFLELLHPDFTNVHGGSVINGVPNEVRNTWESWKIIPTSRPTVVLPQQKRTVVDIQGSNGVLDLTYENVRYPVFGNREGEFEFIVDFDAKPFPILYSEISSFLHGRTGWMILEDDPEYYYIGSFSVNSWVSGTGGAQSTITIGYSVYPYKTLLINSLDEWEWDPFNFYTGVIYNGKYSIDASESLNNLTQSQFNKYKSLGVLDNSASWNSSNYKTTFMQKLKVQSLEALPASFEEGDEVTGINKYSAWKLIYLFGRDAVYNDYHGTGAKPVVPVIIWRRAQNESQTKLIVNYVHEAIGVDYSKRQTKYKIFNGNSSSSNIELIKTENVTVDGVSYIDEYYVDNDMVFVDMYSNKKYYLQFLGLGTVKIKFNRGEF